MSAPDPRLARLAKMLALHDDPAATEGERAACRHLGGKLAADIGIEFSREAIERAGGFEHQKRGASSYDFDVDEWLRQWMAKTQEQREAHIRDIRETIRKWEEDLKTWDDEHRAREEKLRAAEEERAHQKAERDAAMRRYHEEETARKEAEKQAEKAERERLRRVRAGLAPPQWDDLDDDHLAWLDRIEALELQDDDRRFIEGVRAAVRDQRLGCYGEALARMNRILARAAAMGARA
jgi:hypothetical protein